MNFRNYVIISILLIILLSLYYYIQKPKRSNLEETYSQYLLRSTKPDTAFTYKQLKNGHYENYYLNYDTSNPNLLNRVESEYPVTSTGVDYKPREHGTVVETEKGFTITGCDKAFECPPNWIWNSELKTCTVESICKDEDNGMFKGLDEYHYNLSNVQDKITDLETSRLDKYHAKLYVHCLENGDFELKECKANSVFNQKQVQPDTVGNPCVKYDICENLREYTIHKYDIGNGYNLDDNEYYMCIDGKSVLKQCKTDSVFNVDANACVEINKCALKDNGYTFPNNDSSFIYCNNGQELIINCGNGVYTGKGSTNLECNVDKSKDYKDYFRNDYITMPISLYVYKDNVESVFNAEPGTFVRAMPLKPDTSGFFPDVRNTELFKSVTFNANFVEYVNAADRLAGRSVALNLTNYKQYATTYIIAVSYYKSYLDDFMWNVIEDKPQFSDPTPAVYYKYDTKIKHLTNENVLLNSVDYFYFVTATEIYKPKSGGYYAISSDANTGILHYADFKIPSVVTLNNSKLTLGWKVLDFTKTSDERYIFYYVDPVSRNLVAIVFSVDVVFVDAFEGDTANPGFIKPKLYKTTHIQSTGNNDFHVRIQSLNWYGSVSGMKDYVIPEFLACISFYSYEQLDKQFTILNSELITSNSDLSTFKTTSENLYVPGSTLQGNYLDLKKIQDSINNLLLEKP